ncbi:hypothetical protein ACH4T8_37100, partial [Streptomyces olivaceus]
MWNQNCQACRSWLLDEQWADYLPDASNIMRLQHRFTVSARPTSAMRPSWNSSSMFHPGRSISRACHPHHAPAGHRPPPRKRPAFPPAFRLTIPSLIRCFKHHPDGHPTAPTRG